MTDDIDEIVRRIRRMADPASTDNDLATISQAADAIERMKAERDNYLNAYKEVVSERIEAEARAEAAEKRLAEAEKVIRACQAVAIRHDGEATRMVIQFLNEQSHDQ